MRTPRAVAVVLDPPRVLLITRYRRYETSADCDLCEDAGSPGPGCPGHHYAVLPGGHVEQGESAEAAVLRELAEETALRARISRLLWTRGDGGRPATYYLMGDVAGTPVLSGPEAAANRPENAYALRWATAEEFDELNLQPSEVRGPLAELLCGA